MNVPGFHIMAMPSRQWAETLTGLGAADAEMILTGVEHYPTSGHPLIPVAQRYVPMANRLGNIQFQITRGLFGVSL